MWWNSPFKFLCLQMHSNTTLGYKLILIYIYQSRKCTLLYIYQLKSNIYSHWPSSAFSWFMVKTDWKPLLIRDTTAYRRVTTCCPPYVYKHQVIIPGSGLQLWIWYFFKVSKPFSCISDPSGFTSAQSLLQRSESRTWYLFDQLPWQARETSGV